MIVVDERIWISEDELEWSFARSGGPGGQNVNKVASKAVLRWKVMASPSVAPDVKARLVSQQRNRVTSDGDLIVVSQRYRDQERNRQDCVEKLVAMLRQALFVPKKRRPTKPTAGSKRRRLEDKKRRGAVKRERGGRGVME
jgi:ribosome-associated protein